MEALLVSEAIGRSILALVVTPSNRKGVSSAGLWYKESGFANLLPVNRALAFSSSETTTLGPFLLSQVSSFLAGMGRSSSAHFASWTRSATSPTPF